MSRNSLQISTKTSNFVRICQPHSQSFCTSALLLQRQDFDDWEDGLRGMKVRPEFGSGLKKKNWQDIELVSHKATIYTPLQSATERDQTEVESFRRENAISIVRGADKTPNPTMSFDETGFPDEIMKVLQSEGFDKPMPIQVT